MSAVDAFENHAASFESWRSHMKSTPVLVEDMTPRRLRRMAERKKRITVGHVARHFQCTLPTAYRALAAATDGGALIVEGGGPGESLYWRAA